MSNQNNTMQKLEMASNVNLSRYKKNIDGTVKINDTNMPVLGNKFNPMMKEVTEWDTVHMGIINGDPCGYNNYYSDDADSGIYEYRVTNANEYITASDMGNMAVGILSKDRAVVFNLDHYEIICFDATGLQPIQLPHMGDTNTGKFATWKIANNQFVLSNGKGYTYIDLTDINNPFQFHTQTNRKIIDVVSIPRVTDYVNETNYVYNSLSGVSYGSYVIYMDTDTNKVYMNNIIAPDMIKLLDTGSDNPSCNFMAFNNAPPTGENRCKIVLDRSLYVMAEYGEEVVRITPTVSVPGYVEIDQIKTNLTSYNYLKVNFQENGWLYSNAVQFGDNNKFKLLSSNPLMASNHSDVVHTAINWNVSLENGVPVDNFVFATFNNDSKSPSWFQGCNIIAHCGIPMGVINQNYMYFELNKSNLSNILKCGNNWYKVETLQDHDASGYADLMDVPLINDDIYYGNIISGIYGNAWRKCSIGVFDYSTYDTFFSEISNVNYDKYFTSIDDWTSKAKYWVIGNDGITKGNYRLPQLAPILTAGVENIANWAKYHSIDCVYYQKDNTDSTLYNYKDETYLAPTEGDFYIPLMPTDKVVSSSPSGIIIERIDGSKAELLRYNNKYYPAYYYSTISENIEYTFVCQGQVYNVSGGIIYDSEGKGVIDVSDQKFLGSNGIIALFYNERTKTIYQFSASNVLEVLLECDFVGEITSTDINHTNDEIYIGILFPDESKKYICIDSDGQIYTIANELYSNPVTARDGLYLRRVNNSGNGYIWDKFTLMAMYDTVSTQNNYIETNYFGTDEFKLMNVERVYLRFTPINENGTNNTAIVNFSILTLDGEINEQYTIDLTESIHRIAPTQKNCIGIKIRIDGLDNYTLAALSIGVTDDCNIVTDNVVQNNRLDAKMFD